MQEFDHVHEDFDALDVFVGNTSYGHTGLAGHHFFFSYSC
jgi:hypothetical protein